MKTLLNFAVLAFAAISTHAQTSTNHCAVYVGKERYLKAIEIVAKNHNMTLDQLCQAQKYLGIEAQPSRKITREGEVIPHVAVQLHMYSSSCLYMIRDSDLSLTDGRCYSGE